MAEGRRIGWKAAAWHSSRRAGAACARRRGGRRAADGPGGSAVAGQTGGDEAAPRCPACIEAIVRRGRTVMIFLKPQVLHALDKPGGLESLLQTAIELEHATIPTYLYSLYSLNNSNMA